ncbi:DUF134 domain-containing protein [Shewanella frigidimarina]|uniref:DUF134 domain-containing protein n=1 Tax=Shewanella frigidimarina TaxID=56812 RepID=UPI003D792E8D
MPRPKIQRTICGVPANICFKPNGIPMKQPEQIASDSDEFEALRLVDLLKMQQRHAAIQMGVSRQTLANVLKSARFKLMDCLTHGKALLMKNAPEEKL